VPTEQEADTRLLLAVKGNVAADRQPGLKFAPVPKIAKLKDGIEIETAAIEWDAAPVEMVAGEWFALERARLKSSEPKGAKGAAIVFLKVLLGDGQEHPSTEVLAAAAKEGIKRGSLHAAREDLKIVVRKLATEDGSWTWCWPDALKEDKPPKPEEPKPEPKPKSKSKRKIKNNVIIFPAVKKPAS
jgi:hypothetical protein